MTAQINATVSPVSDVDSGPKAFIEARAEAHAAETAKLRDLDYVRGLGAKKGASEARRAFMRRVDALTGR